MDLDKAFIYALLKGGSASLAKAQMDGFSKDLLTGEGYQAYELIEEHLASFNDLPSLQVVEGKGGIVIDPVVEPVEFWVNELKAREAYTGLQDSNRRVSDLLQNNKPFEALDYLSDRVRKIKAGLVGGSDLTSLPGLTVEARLWYDRIKNGERGIPFPWPSITETTMGMWPEDLILFVARGGVGKTWAAIHVAITAWRAGNKVLFVSTEMAQYALALRFISAYLLLPYAQVRNGTLGVFQEKKWEDAQDELVQDDRLMVVGGAFDYSVDTIWAHVDAFEPDLVVVDGLYLLRTSEKSEKKNERAASVYDELKRGGKRFKIPICSTTQFNREVKSGSKSPDIAHIAQTDAAGWNCDAAFALRRDDKLKSQKRLIMVPMKIREGDMDEIECHWDFDSMNFTECVKNKPTPPGGGPGPGSGSPNPSAPPSGSSQGSGSNNDDLGSLF